MSKGSVGPKALYKARVAATPEFYPGYTKADGTKVGHRCVARVYVNPVGRKRESGERDELPPMKFTVTAWGRAAEDWAKNASIGKTIDYLLVEERQYQSKVYVGDQPVIQANGEPLMTTRSSYTALEWFWGDDAAKIIAEDIRHGHRHYGWDGKLDVGLLQQTLAQGGDAAVRSLIQQATQAQEAWKATIKARRAAQFVPGSTHFGWAVVKQTSSAAPQQQAGFQGQVNHAVNNQAPAQGYQPPAQPTQPAYNAPATGYAPPVEDPNRGVNPPTNPGFNHGGGGEPVYQPANNGFAGNNSGGGGGGHHFGNANQYF